VGKGNGGGIGALLRSCGIEGEERRGGGGLVRAAPCRWRTAWGAWRPARRMTGGGERGLEKCEQGRRGWRAWAVREGVGQPGKGGAGPGPREQWQSRFKPNFQTEQDLNRSKTGFLLTKNFQIKYGFVGN
jgi:hypothetical protein